MAGTGLQPAAIAITFIFPACSFLIVAVRFWRRIVERSFAGEDVVLALAMALAITYCFVDYTYIKLGRIGYHDEDLTPEGAADFTTLLKYLYVESIIYNPILCLVKASFLWTLMKLRSHRVWVNRALWTIQIINGVYMVGTTLASIFACDPIKGKWDMEAAKTAKCYDIAGYVISSICIVILTDILVLSIPTWMIYDLHMPRARKIVIILFLSFGLAVTAIGAVRLHYMINVFVFKKSSNYSIAQTYSTMESNIAIIGACGPTVKWVLSRCIPWLETAGTTSRQYNPNYSGVSRSQRPTGFSNTANGTFQSRRRNNDDDECMYPSRDQDIVELKEGAGWNNQHTSVEADGGSDSTNYNRNNSLAGITKTVEWNVASGEAGRSPPGGVDERSVKPKDVL